jgi:hypothetical protein
MEDPDWQSAALQMLQRVGPTLPELAEQLGWPPPPAIIDRWCKQLDEAADQLTQLGLIVRCASLADFQIDPAGMLYWMLLPQRLKQSSATSNLTDLSNIQLTFQPTGQGTATAHERPTAAAPQTQELWDVVTDVDSVQLIGQLQRRLRASAATTSSHSPLFIESPTAPELREPNTTCPKLTEPKVTTQKKTQGSRSTMVITATALLALAIVGTSWWWSVSQMSKNNATTANRTTPQLAAKLSLPALAPATAIDEGPVETGPVETGPIAMGDELKSFHATLFASGSFDQSLDLAAAGLLPRDLPFEPNIDLQTGPAENVALQPSSPQGIPAADSAPAFVSLPDRTDTTEQSLGSLTTAGLKRWNELAPRLEFPSTASWALLADEPHACFVVPAADVGAESAVARFFISHTDSAREADATPGEIHFQWLDRAAAESRAETLRNGRLVIGDRTLWLREPQVQPMLHWQFQTATEQHSWPLDWLPDSRRTVWTLAHRVIAVSQLASDANDAAAMDNRPGGAKGDRFARQPAAPLFIQWLNPITTQPSKNVRGLLEVRLTQEDPVAVRIRVDAKLDRHVTVTTLAAATIGVQSGWQEVQWSMVDAVSTSTTQWQKNAELLLEQIRQQIRVAPTGEQRSMLRDRRSLLEQSLEHADTTLQGLKRLHSLLLRIEQEVRLQIRLEVKWPAGNQLIFALADNPQEAS